MTFRIGGLPGNAKLKSLVVGSTSIDLTAADPGISVPFGSTTVSVVAATDDESATYKILGNKDLITGENTVTVRVTAADGSTARDYAVKVTVAAPSSNSNVTSLKLNGVERANGAYVTLPAGTTSVVLEAIAEDPKATVTYFNFKNLTAGDYQSTRIIVRAQDQSYQEYNFFLNIPELSSNTSLKRFTIQGISMLSKTKLTVLPGTTKLHVSAEANDPGASVTITGRDIKAGFNNVTVTVIAADGTSQSYVVRVKA